MDNNEQFKVESYISDSRLAFLVFHFLVKIISGNTLENWDIEIEKPPLCNFSCTAEAFYRNVIAGFGVAFRILNAGHAVPVLARQ